MHKRWIVVLFLMTLTALLSAQDRTQAELRFVPATSADRHAGVWVDGHYVGYVDELKGSKRVRLLPGMHEIAVRQAWYDEYIEKTFFEPGTTHTIQLSLKKKAAVDKASANAELKITVVPSRAAVFVDDQFAGHSDEFDGIGKAMLLPPGQHRVTVALPGYVPFETTLNVQPHQKVRIAAKLVRGSVKMAGPLVTPE